MRRIVEIVIPGTKSSLTVSARVASLVRQVASAEGRARNISALIEDMADVYIRDRHPDWEHSAKRPLS